MAGLTPGGDGERRDAGPAAAPGPRTGRAGRIVGWVVGVALLAGLVAVLDAVVGWRELLRPWTAFPPLAVAGAFLLVLASYVIRTVRIHRYFHDAARGRFGRTLRLVLLHNLLNNLFPMRSGEASFPLLMKRELGVGYGRSIGGLLYLRLLDLHFLLLLGAIVLATDTGGAAWLAPVALAPVPWMAYRFQERARSRIDPTIGIGPLRAGPLLDGLPDTGRLFGTTVLWTAVNWSVKLAVFAAVLRIFLPMPFPAALLGSVTGELSSVLPVHGVAGAGTYEAGVLAGLVPLGLDARAALGAAVNLHLFVLGASVLSAALGLLLPLRAGSRARNRS